MSSSSVVLLTGATGFLGGHLLRTFAAEQIAARALVRTPVALPGDPALVVGSPLLLPTDVGDFEGVTTIVHTAAVVKHSRTVPEDLFSLNVDGTLHMVRLAASLGARLIFVSTSGTVGCFAHADITADEDAFYAEALAGRWPYYQSKIRAEREATRLAAKLGVELVIVRPPVLLGPDDHRFRSSGHVLGMMRGNVPLVPRGGMHFADVRDVAAAIARIVTLDTVRSIYHLPGTATTLADFFHMIEDVTGASAPERSVPPMVLQGAARTLHRAFRVAGKAPPHWVPDPVITEMASCYWGLSSLWTARELAYQTRAPRQTLADTAGWLRANHPALLATRATQAA